jgi:tRNA threonylcarbamoyladenosine biosynthesis protein TsaB
MISRILAIDTTSDFGSLALLESGVTVHEMPLHSTDGFGHMLFPNVDSLLKQHGWPLDSVDAFAAASGPGSFTGVRVGLAAVKGLADSMNKPVVAVSNLRAIAAYGSYPLRAALIDARRGEVYGGLYDENALLVGEEAVMPFAEWLAMLPPGPIEFLSQRPDLFATLVNGPHTEVPRELAAAIGRIAASELAQGRGQDALAVDANYVRRTDAELCWKE